MEKKSDRTEFWCAMKMILTWNNSYYFSYDLGTSKNNPPCYIGTCTFPQSDRGFVHLQNGKNTCIAEYADERQGLDQTVGLRG